MMSHPRFWISSVIAAAAFSVLSVWLFPYAPLGIEGEARRYQVWLLTLWTTGVMSICFGATGLFSSIIPLGFRDVAEAGSVAAAREARRRRYSVDSPFFNFAGWAVTTGSFLLIIYFAAWFAGR
jgi:hypothetical protein